MKYLVIFCIVLYVATVAKASLMNDKSDEDAVIDDVDKRDSLKDILSSDSCRYLRTNGYLSKHVDLKTLCLKTLDCKDILTSSNCDTVKSRNVCSKNTDISNVYCRYTCNKCGGAPCSGTVPLGMQSRAIPDSKITASSMYDNRYKPSNSRLHMNSRGWTPYPARVGEWLQVDLSETTMINGIATQGSKGIDEWMKSFSLQYSNDGETFLHYKSDKIFPANSDQNTVIWNKVDPPIDARYIRVQPKTWYSYPSFRMELYGCK